MNGIFDSRWSAFAWLCLSIAAVVGCRGKRAAPPPPPPPVVTVTRPVTFPVQKYYEYNGNLEAVEVVDIVARVRGFLETIAFTDGREVAKGDLLFKIDPREYSSGVKRGMADKRKAEAELKVARSEESRVKALRTTGAISEEDYEQRVATRETAEATVMQTEAAIEAAELQLSYTEIRSPIDGLISRTRVTRGNLVGHAGNTLLTTIVSMDPLYVYFDVPESDLVEYQRSLKEEQVNEILEGSIPVEVGVASEIGYPHVGFIDFRENRVDVATGTVRIRGRIPNPRLPPADARLLYPGLYARVCVPSGTPRPMIAIPEDALMTGQEGRFVFVLGENQIVEKRTVTVGPSIWKGAIADDVPGRWLLGHSEVDSASDSATGESTEPLPSVVAIESGLSTEDVIVVKGLTKARPGFAVAPEMRSMIPPAVPQTSEKP